MSASREPRNTFERVLARRTEAMAEGQAQRVTELMHEVRIHYYVTAGSFDSYT